MTPIPGGRTPTGICILPDESRVYVTNFDDDTVSVIHAREDRVETVPCGKKPFAAAADPARSHRKPGVPTAPNSTSRSSCTTPRATTSCATYAWRSTGIHSSINAVASVGTEPPLLVG